MKLWPNFAADAVLGGAGADTARGLDVVRLRRVGTRLLWFFAGFGMLWAIVVQPLGATGTDFDPIWSAVSKYVGGRPVYDEDYSNDLPHYLYSPGATFLIGWMGWLPGRDLARWVGLLGGGASIVAALWILARAAAGRRGGIVFAGLVAGTFFFHEPVQTTLIFTNINGFLFLLEAVFLVCWLSARRAMHTAGRPRWRWNLRAWRRVDVLAGAAVLAVALTIKPQFVVLAMLAFLTGQWALLAVACVLFLVFFGAGYATMAQPGLYFERLVPYLATPRSYANGSIDGIAEQRGWDPAAAVVLKVALVAAAAVAVWALWRWRERDPFLFAATAVSVGFAAVLMTSGLMQGYYVVWIFPLLATVVRPVSPMHAPWPWLAFFAIMGPGINDADQRGALSPVVGNLASVAWLLLPAYIAYWALRHRPAAAAAATAA